MSVPVRLANAAAPGPGLGVRRLLHPDAAGPLAILVLTGLVGWVSDAYPAQMPVWAPWDFSPTEFIATALALWWYGRGLALSRPEERPNIARSVSYVTGVVVLYAVLQTRFEYAALHMFFLNRIQHLGMHHLGPFLVALAWPGATIARGMPPRLRRVFENKVLCRVVRIVQHPIPAGLLFVGIIDFWLIPSIHFAAMINHHLYTVMNWTMVVDGFLFWFLVLDPRPSPPARVSFGIRMLTVVLVMFPQIAVGAYITFGHSVFYPFYDLCGRLIPSMNGLTDQMIGGIVVWIPASMMSSVAFMLSLNFVRLHEESRKPEDMTEEERRMAALAARWTGR